MASGKIPRGARGARVGIHHASRRLVAGATAAPSSVLGHDCVYGSGTLRELGTVSVFREATLSECVETYTVARVHPEVRSTL